MYAQKTDSIFAYKTQFCLNNFNVDEFLKVFESRNYTKENIISFATNMALHGNEKYGNELAKKCISKNDSITAGNWHAYSVQNTKNGNYAEAIYGLENSLAIAANEMEGYYGWVLLYYYRDYNRALLHLNHYDSLTPKVVDAPVGENIHFLKGLCYYQLNEFEKSITEFKINENFEINSFSKKNVNAYIYFYIARNYDKLNNLKLAETYYKKAIKQAQFPVEANYYLGLLYKYKIKNSKKASSCLDTSFKYVIKGYKQQDIYVELFDEVYYLQIKEEIENKILIK
jgi:tetratricopeptide (TPR) repeat protein